MKKFIAMTGFALSAIFTPVAKAQTRLDGAKDRLFVVAETTSHHFSKDQYNEFNPGIGAEYRISPTFHTGAGIYYNSLERASVYALIGAETNGARFFGAGLEVGAVSGYLDDGKKIAPAAMPYLRIGRRTDVANLKLCYMPYIEDITPAMVSIQARINLFGGIKALKRKR